MFTFYASICVNENFYVQCQITELNCRKHGKR